MATPTSKHYNGFLLPNYAEDYMSQYLDFEVRDDDIYIACFPKCGTTWLQNLVYLVVHGFDFVDPMGERLDFRVPYIELKGLEDAKARQGLRILKTHMPYSLLPPAIHRGKSKVVTVARNPKDVAVSFYYFARRMKHFEFNGDTPTFLKLFLHDKVDYAPYEKYLEEYWQHRNDDNMLFLFYEDMQKDLSASVTVVAKFLNRDLSPEVVDRITSQCSFKSLQKNPNVNYSWREEEGVLHKDAPKFIRKGEVGDWQNHLTPEESKEIEDKFKYLEKHGLKFTYVL